MRKGFTLIEVLIVIIIIGILATLALPRITGVIERARIAEAKNVMGTIRTALMLDAGETNAFPASPDSATMADLQAAMGDVTPPFDLSHFNYTYTTPAAPGNNVSTIYAERNDYEWQGQDPGSHAQLQMTIDVDGTSTRITIRYNNSAVPANAADGSGTCATGW